MKQFEHVMTGLQVRVNQNGFFAVRMHYTADEDKRTTEWYNKTRRGYTEPAWQREYEIDFGAFGGTLVFEEFFRKWGNKIVMRPFEVPDAWPKFAVMDYGSLSPTAFYVYTLNPDDQMIFIWEYYSPGPLSKHAEAILGCPYFSKLAWITVDPSLVSKTQNVEGNLRSIQELLEDGYGIFTIPGDNNRLAGLERIKWHWRNLDDREPTLLITEDCSKLLWELPRLRYQEWSSAMQQRRNPKEDVVPKDDHAFDALKYGVLSQPKNEPNPLAIRGLGFKRAQRLTTRNTICADTFGDKEGDPILGKFYG